MIGGDTYNYYYYNTPPSDQTLEEAQKKYEQAPPPRPAEENQTDRYFDRGVQAFEAGDYTAATSEFHEAQKLSPNDIVLPFARVQALFASGQYHEATSVLREALAITTPDKEGVFYPRGLYTRESVLLGQIEQLSRVAHLNPSDSDLRLLLGYQLLGMNKLDEAAEHLHVAKLDTTNSPAATQLTKLLDKLRKPTGENSDTKEQQPVAPTLQEAPPSGDGSAKTPPTPKREDVNMVALATAADNWLAK